MFEKFKLDILEAIKLSLFSTSSSICIVGHYDCDGISASSILSQMLDREGKENEVVNVVKLDIDFIKNLNTSDFELIIFVDLGSGQKDILHFLEKRLIIIDHHLPQESPNKSFLELNAHSEGLNGSLEVCSSSMAFLVAVYINPMNKDLVYLAVAGIFGDRQHIGNPKGFNLELIEKYGGNEILINDNFLFENKNLSKSLSEMFDPYLVGYSGRPEEVDRDLIAIGLKPDLPTRNLDNNSKIALGEWVKAKLRTQKITKDYINSFLTSYYSSKLDINIYFLHWLIDTSGRKNDFSTAHGVCKGKKISIKKATKYFDDFRSLILEYLQEVEKNLIEYNCVQYFFINDNSSGGITCGIAMDSFLNRSKPVFSFCNHNGMVKLSARGNIDLVHNGLDLSAAVSESAKKFGGSGGGHAIAAGGRFPYEFTDSFLREVNDIIHSQMY